MKITYSQAAAHSLAEMTRPPSKQWDTFTRLLGYDPWVRAEESWTAKTLHEALRDMLHSVDRWAYTVEESQARSDH